jgi:two-component system nitrogen regulation sensor histidine kinase GlnL
MAWERDPTDEEGMAGGNEHIIDCVDDGIIVVDAQMTIETFNQAAEGITGFSRQSVLGRPFHAPFRRSPLLLAQVQRTLQSGQTTLHHDAEMVTHKGATRFISLTCSPVRNDAGKTVGVAVVFRDRTRLREMEEQRRHSDRLALLGTMAAGIAHEVKNPLGGIRGAAQILQKGVKEGVKEGNTDQRTLVECTELIIDQADRIDRLIEELLEFSSPKKLRIADVNVNKILNDMIRLLQAEVGDGVVFKVSFDPSLPPVRGDERRLAQIFLNLLKNAVEAVRGLKKGTIRVISKMDLDLHLGGMDHSPRPMIAVEIVDNGPGVRGEDLEKLFTPFFTTKARGSGLGLAVSHKLVQEHGGTLKLSSRYGEGTAVRVTIPAAETR